MCNYPVLYVFHWKSLETRDTAGLVSESSDVFLFPQNLFIFFPKALCLCLVYPNTLIDHPVPATLLQARRGGEGRIKSENLQKVLRSPLISGICARERTNKSWVGEQFLNLQRSWIYGQQNKKREMKLDVSCNFFFWHLEMLVYFS